MSHSQSTVGHQEQSAKRDDNSWCSGERHWRWGGRRAKRHPDQGEKLPEPEKKHDDSTVERIKGLPTSIGVILVAAGVAGLILPGPFGTPLLLAGGLVLAPRAFGRVDAYMKSRYPTARHHGVKMIERFLDDLQKRYPDEPQSDT
jgi:hypothetical protein